MPAALSTAGALRELDTIASFDAAIDQCLHELDRAGVGLDALGLEDLLEHDVLAVAETSDRLVGRRVGRLALGQLDAARLEEAPDAVVARLAVDVREVVGVDVRLGDASTLKELAEHLGPGAHVHLGRRRDHTVEVEQGSVVVVPVHASSVRPTCCRAVTNARQHA